MGNEAAKAGQYKEPDLPPGVLEVRLSVYKLRLTGMGVFDEIGSGFLGAYHSAIVVAGEEWSFGGHDQEGISGVYTTTPEMNEEYSFYDRISLGTVNMTKKQVDAEILNLAANPRWAGPRYDLTSRNCNHFASDACWTLLKKRPPEWVNKTADGIAQQNRVSYAYTKASADGLYSYTVAMAPNNSVFNVTGEVPGETAFKGTFQNTFNMAWERRWEAGKHRIQECPENVDPEVVKLEVETHALDFAAEAAEAAGWAVAAGARRARCVREELAASGRPGLAAWDEAWKNASAPLVAQWREAAMAGTLKMSHITKPVPGEGMPSVAMLNDGELRRMQQVENALNIATAAAEKAAAEADSATLADPSLEGYHR